MQTEGSRLRYYIENKEVSVRKFCLENDIKYNSFQQILNGDRNLGLIVLRQVKTIYPNLNLNWVITGTGGTEINQEDNAIIEPISIYGDIDPGFEAFLKYLDKDITKNKILEIIEQKLNAKDKPNKTGK